MSIRIGRNYSARNSSLDWGHHPMLDLCGRTKGNPAFADDLLERISSGFANEHRFTDTVIRTAICRLEDCNRTDDAYNVMCQALQKGYDIPPNSVEHIFCKLRDIKEYDKALDLIRLSTDVNIRFKHSTIKFTIRELLEHNDVDTAKRFVEVAYECNYELGELGNNPRLQSTNDHTITPTRHERRPFDLTQYIQASVSKARRLRDELTDSLKAQIEVNPQLAYDCLAQLFDQEEGLFNYSFIAEEIIRKFFKTNNIKLAGDLASLCLYRKGISIDSEIIKQVATAIELQGDLALATDLRKFC